MTRYKVIDYKRKYAKELTYEDIDNVVLSYEDDVHKKIIEKENEEDLLNLLSCLSEEDREIFKKLYFEDKSTEEVSYEMGLGRDKIYNRVSRGKKRIKSYMKVRV